MVNKKYLRIALAFTLLFLSIFLMTACSNNEYSIPFFGAGGLVLGGYVDDVNMKNWKESNLTEWDYTGEIGSFRLNSERRIDKIYVNPQIFTEGIWSFFGIQPRNVIITKAYFEAHATIDDIRDRFGNGSRHNAASGNGDDELSYIIFEDKTTGIIVEVGYISQNGRIVHVIAEGLPYAVAPRPTPVPPRPTPVPNY